MDKPSFKPAVEIGLISLMVSTVFLISAYVFDLSLLTSFGAGIVIIVIRAVLLALSPIQVRKKAGGFISFKHAFSAVVISTLVSSIPYLIIAFLLFKVIDPDAAVQMKELTIQATADSMQSWGVDQATIDQSIEEIDKTDQYSFASLFKGLLTSVIVAALYGLIVAAIVKKNPEFE